MFREYVWDGEKKNKTFFLFFFYTVACNQVIPLRLGDIHYKNWLGKTPNNPFTGKSRVAFSHVSLFFPNSLPGSYEQGRAQKLGVTCVRNWCCEKVSFVKENSSAKTSGAGWKSPSTFSLFYFPFGRDVGRAASPGDICSGIMWFLALPK